MPEDVPLGIPQGNRSKSLFIEVGGSGLMFSGNIDFRFKRGQNYGLGMRLGFGIGEFSLDIFGEETNKLTSGPFEINYILGKRNFAPEFGLGFTYTHIKKESYSSFLGYHSSFYGTGDYILSYVPVGFRIKPKINGFMLKLNAGPVINYNYPNLWSDNGIDFWIGLAIGYTFSKN